MDDLEVIRSAVKAIIPEGRIAREGMDVKEKFGKWRGKHPREPYLTHLQVFPQSLGTVLGGKHLFRGKGAKAEDSK